LPEAWHGAAMHRLPAPCISKARAVFYELQLYFLSHRSAIGGFFILRESRLCGYRKPGTALPCMASGGLDLPYAYILSGIRWI
jgi:hypothetical protein